MPAGGGGLCGVALLSGCGYLLSLAAPRQQIRVEGVMREAHQL
jgi:hypothetical protein